MTRRRPGTLRNELGSNERGILRPSSAFVDGQIAAIARVNALILVTANVRHYERFAGLTVEDWRAPR